MTSPPTDDAVRILAAAMAAANLVAITLILRWERSGREARVLAPARWRLPRFGTALTALPFLYPVVALGAPGWLAWRVSALLHALGAAGPTGSCGTRCMPRSCWSPPGARSRSAPS